MLVLYTQALSGSNAIEMGRLNVGYNREPEIEFRNGQNGAAAAAAVQNSERTEPKANDAARGREVEAGAETSPDAEPEGDVPPFTLTLLRVYGKPLLISQVVYLGWAILLYAYPMLLWYSTFGLCDA